MTRRKPPNVVGAAEAAEILGVEVQRISRWQSSNKLPEALELAATPVWHTATIEAVARGARANGKPPRDLVGTSEAAAICGGVNKSQIGRWRRAGKFPEPCKELKAGPLWWAADVEKFQAKR